MRVDVADSVTPAGMSGAIVPRLARDSGRRFIGWIILAVAFVVVGGAVFITWLLTEKQTSVSPVNRSIPLAPGPDNTIQHLTPLPAASSPSKAAGATSETGP